MKPFNNLLDFLAYCEEVCSMDEQDDDFFLLTILANVSTITKERILEDLNKCLEVYYFWLKESITQEMYMCAAQIVEAKQCELEHFINLANIVLSEDITKEIIELDDKINNLYL